MTRISKIPLETCDVLVTLPLGKDLWGHRNKILHVPIVITNTGSTSLQVVVTASLISRQPVRLNQRL